jgi:hypothetical protein
MLSLRPTLFSGVLFNGYAIAKLISRRAKITFTKHLFFYQLLAWHNRTNGNPAIALQTQLLERKISIPIGTHILHN